MPKAKRPPSFGDALADARHHLGLTQGDLGARVGVKAYAVHCWEAGKRFPELLLGRLVGVLFELSREHGENVAEAAGTTLAQLGIHPPPLPAPPPAPPPSPLEDPTVRRYALDAALFAFAARLDIPPRGLRAAAAELFATLDALGIGAAEARAILEAGVFQAPASSDPARWAGS
jgi:DNA-binding XRE family transcriptional regulator